MVFYTTPLLGILSVFVAYEIIRRSANGLSAKVSVVAYTPSQPQKDKQMAQMNPPTEKTLEEEIVQKMAPIGSLATTSTYIDSSFKPVQDKITNASLLH